MFVRSIWVTAALWLAAGGGTQGVAATTSRSLTVSATVAAACAVAWPALLDRARAGAIRPEQVCAPGTTLSAIRPTPPTVKLVADPAAGLSRLTVAF